MKESELVKKIRHAVGQKYPTAYVRKLADRMTRGLPDLLILVDGMVLFVECKTADGRTSMLQKAEHEEIVAAGGSIMVARDVESVLSRLEGMVGA